MKNPRKVCEKALDLPDLDRIIKAQVKSAAAILGQQGGYKGGPARAKSLTPKRRSEIAKKAANKRWHNT